MTFLAQPFYRYLENNKSLVYSANQCICTQTLLFHSAVHIITTPTNLATYLFQQPWIHLRLDLLCKQRINSLELLNLKKKDTLLELIHLLQLLG